MGAIGGLLGVGGGAGGTGFSPQNGTNSQQLASAYTNANNAIANQNQVYGQLQNVAAGQGPNPAQAVLNQATGQNVANQAALMAGQRGAASNVGLLARQAGQQGANIQQQAAGQGASMQAQQQLGALGQAGQTAQGITAAQQNEQAILQGANTANSNIQGQLANTTLQGQQAVAGGILQGLSSVPSLAKGGMVQRFDDGGDVESAPSDSSQDTGPIQEQQTQMADPMDQLAAQANANQTPIQPNGPQSAFGRSLQSQNQTQGQMPTYSSSNPGAAALQKGVASMTSAGQSNKSGGGGGGLMSLLALSKGGDVGNKLKEGGHVPGKARVKGNSYSNDTVKALLSPGEVVIPKSVMESGDPVRGAAQFVHAVMSKKGRK